MEIINLIKNTNSFESLLNILQETTIKVKDSEIHKNLAVLYTVFTLDNPELSSVELECKSIVIQKTPLKVIAYSQPQISYNNYCLVADTELNKDKKIITESLEGTAMMMYFYDNKWIIGTRKCVDSSESFWRSKKSHFELVKEVVGDWEEFCSFHKKDRIYLYVLIHHENRNIIDYTTRFGESYKKLMLTLTRDTDLFRPTQIYDFEQNLIPLDSHYTENINKEYLIVPNLFHGYSILDEFNHVEENINSVDMIKNEGVLIISENQNGSESYVKLQTTSFRTYQETSDIKYLPKSSCHYINLYQKNSLDLYLGRFKDETYCKGFDEQLYQVKGLIDCIFKVLTSEILFIFKLLWDVRFGSQKEDYKDVYMSLSNEYKKIFYSLRGIYFTKRIKDNINNKYVTMKTVYDLLKEYPPEGIVYLIKDRKNMLQSNESGRIYEILLEYHKSEYMEKPLRVIDIAVEFILNR